MNAHTTHAVATTWRCGDYLYACTCHASQGPRTGAEVAALHRAAVARAWRSGWADEPVPRHVLAVLLPESTLAPRRAA